MVMTRLPPAKDKHVTAQSQVRIIPHFLWLRSYSGNGLSVNPRGCPPPDTLGQSLLRNMCLWGSGWCTTPGSCCWLTQIERGVFGSFCFHARRLQKAEIAEPIDEAELPGAKRDSLAIGQASAHMTAIAQEIAGVAAVGIDVHLEVGYTERQHRGKVFIGPDSVNLVIRAGRGDERRRNIAWNRRGHAIAGKGSGTGIDDADKVRARRDARKGIRRAAVLLIEVVVEDRGRGGQFGARRKAHDADFVGIDVPVFGVSAHQADGLLGVIYLVGARVVSVAPQAAAQDDCVDRSCR